MPGLDLGSTDVEFWLLDQEVRVQPIMVAVGTCLLSVICDL